MDRRFQDPLGSRASSCYSSWSDHDAAEMQQHATSEDDWDEGDTFISFTTTETKCEELFEEGLQHKLKGEFDKAIPCFLKCLEGMQECQYFAKLPQTLHTLAELYQSLNCYDKAVEFAQAEKLFYEAVLLDSSKSSEAQESKDSKARTKRKPFSKKPRNQSWRRGSNPAEYGDLLIKKADEYIRLARLCAGEKKFDLALDYCAKAAKIRKSVFGDAHPVTMETLDYLTVLYAEVGRAEYANVLQRARSSGEEKERVQADERGNLLHLEADQSLTSESDKCLNGAQHLSTVSHTSATVSSSCTNATVASHTTMERSIEAQAGNDAAAACKRKEGPMAKEATLLTGEGEEEERRELDSKLTLRACDQLNPSLDQGWKDSPNKETRQDVESSKSSTGSDEDCQNSPHPSDAAKGHHQEMNGIKAVRSDYSDTSASGRQGESLHSCIVDEQSTVETPNDPFLYSTPPPTPKKMDIFYPMFDGSNGTKPTAVITDVLSKAPGCVYVPVQEQGIEHARCLPLWVLLLGAFVELAILAYVFFNSSNFF